MSPQLGVVFFVLGSIFYIARMFGFFNHRQKYKLVPAFLIGNAVGFFIPIHIWVDGLILGGLLVLVDQITFGKHKKPSRK